jgi:hypothetical protein
MTTRHIAVAFIAPGDKHWISAGNWTGAVKRINLFAPTPPPAGR